MIERETFTSPMGKNKVVLCLLVHRTHCTFKTCLDEKISASMQMCANQL